MNSTSNQYREDLSVLRPKFPVKEDSSKVTASAESPTHDVAPTADVTSKVNSVLDSLDKLNTVRRFVDGFTIQIYSGQNREEAVAAKEKVASEVGTLVARVEYVQPKFRVVTGKYFTKLEAQKDLHLLKRYFPTAILVPEKVLIK